MAYQLITSYNFSFSPTSGFNFTRFFFNEVEYLQQQNGEDVYTFYWKNTENQLFDARFSVLIVNEKGFSPLRATFGGVEFSANLSQQSLSEFLSLSLNTLPKLNELRITCCPNNYLSEEQEQILELSLEKLNFNKKYFDQNYHINVSDLPFCQILKSVRYRQLLRKSRRMGFCFQEVLAPNLVEIYTFVARSRERKNRVITMNFEQFVRSFNLFSDNYKVFSVYDSCTLIAVAVTIKLNNESLYTFYLADDEMYLKVSPLIYLISGIYEYCQQNKLSILDLGIASEKGILNKGLAFFKEHLGGISTQKNIFFLS